MKTIFNATLWVIVIGLLTASYSCKCCHKNSTDKSQTSTAASGYVTGTMRKLPLFVGTCSWVIETTDGKRYEAQDIPQEFFVDGLKIKFKFTVLEGMMSTCQTGTMIKVSEIKKQ